VTARAGNGKRGTVALLILKRDAFFSLHYTFQCRCCSVVNYDVARLWGDCDDARASGWDLESNQGKNQEQDKTRQESGLGALPYNYSTATMPTMSTPTCMHACQCKIRERHPHQFTNPESFWLYRLRHASGAYAGLGLFARYSFISIWISWWSDG
jgi:hypothetical protein